MIRFSCRFAVKLVSVCARSHLFKVTKHVGVAIARQITGNYQSFPNDTDTALHLCCASINDTENQASRTDGRYQRAIGSCAVLCGNPFNSINIEQRGKQWDDGRSVFEAKLGRWLPLLGESKKNGIESRVTMSVIYSRQKARKAFPPRFLVFLTFAIDVTLRDGDFNRRIGGGGGQFSLPPRPPQQENQVFECIAQSARARELPA